jgi:hypothetical protein
MNNQHFFACETSKSLPGKPLARVSYHRIFHSIIGCLTAVLSVTQSFGQTNPAYNDLINKIQAQEIRFPFPQKDTTVLVGQIDLRGYYPIIKYAVRSYQSGRHQCCGIYVPDLHTRRPHEPESDFVLGVRNIPDSGGIVDVKNYLRLTLRFTIVNWPASTNSFTLALGPHSQTVQRGATEIVFSNILETALPISFAINGQHIDLGAYGFMDERSSRVTIPSPLEINWSSAGAGIVTLPVLPVKIVYAPIADAAKQNTASISNSASVGYTNSFSISTSNSVSTPLPTSIQPINGVATDMSNTGRVLSAIPTPYTQAVGQALTVVGGLVTGILGTTALNQTVVNSVTDTHTCAVNETQTESLQAKVSNGGPGQGDVICFYTNAKLLWFCYNGTMKLTLIGYDPSLKTPSAKQLADALRDLRLKPPGTKDDNWHLDCNAIQSLLDLDPFTKNGGDASVQLDPSRFTIARKLDGSDAVFQNGAADETETITHQITTTDLHSIVSVTTTVETDKPGFLSFMGIGETDEKTLSSTFSNGSSSLSVIGQTVSAQFTLHGNGHESYNCAAYFDNIFGTFAFRDYSAELDNANNIGGTVLNAQNHIMSNATLVLNTGASTFTTTTNTNGQFQFKLPKNLKPGKLTLFTNTASTDVNFVGKPVSNIKLKLAQPQITAAGAQ